jgi:DNA invertase Pin-like site-specific DNA recombinase
MKNTQAISYVRFSTPGQIDGDSIRRQTEATEAYCKKHGLTLTDAYRLQDKGKSAFKGVHRNPTGALGILEKQVADGKIPKGTVLIVENLDRLSREDITTAQLLLLNLIKNGIEIVALTDNERRYSLASVNANPFELMVSIMVLSRAHEESKIKSYRATQSWVQRNKLAAEGKHINMRLPAWLESRDGRYVTIPEKVKIIKRMFSLYLSGYGTSTVAAMLIKEKVPNIAKVQKAMSARWCGALVHRHLKNKELLGFYMGISPEVPNFFPAVVSESDFYAVQAKLAQRNKFKGQRIHNPHPFTHLIKCSLCGESIIVVSGNGYMYYQCRGARVKLCKPKTLPYYQVERALLAIIAATDATTFTIDDTAALQAQQKIDAQQGRLKELQDKLSTAQKLFVDTPSESGAKILQQLELEQSSVRKQLDDDRNSTFIVDNRSDWNEVKARVEATMTTVERTLFEVVPVSIKESNGEQEVLRHRTTSDDDDMIALRESLRSQIEKITMNIPEMRATLHCKSGKTVAIEFKRGKSYPRQFSYRTDTASWIALEPLPSRQPMNPINRDKAPPTVPTDLPHGPTA